MNLRDIQFPRVRLLLNRLVEVCYPGVCVVCHRFCESACPLCEECEEKLEALEAGAACGRCAKPLPVGASCPWCMGKGVYPYQRIVRLGVYDEPLRDLIHQMKYGGRWTLAETLADRLWRRPEVREILGQAERIVAVPLHYRRQFGRGYNQSALIARRLARQAGLRTTGAVKRIRDTETQTQLHSLKARVENVRGAFALTRPRAIRGKHVVVVDDVMTSGATLRAIGRALLTGEPASLCAIVMAVADSKGRQFQAI